MKTSFNLKTMFSIFLAAPFIVIIVMIYIFMGVAESRSTTSRSLQAPKYLIAPLMHIIENDYEPETPAKGILLLIDSEGKTLYPAGTDTQALQRYRLPVLFESIIVDETVNMSIIKYYYKGEAAYCFFDNSFVPAVLKKQIRIGVSLFIVIISCMGLIFGQVSTVIINNSIEKLINASDRIANGNLDEKVTLKYNNELLHVATALDRMRLELKEKRNVEQRFVMSVTHDLKTPLTSINGYIEALDDGIISDPAEISETINLIRKKTELLDGRINELLDYSKSRTAGWREQWASVGVHQWLSGISSMFSADSELYGRKYIADIKVDEKRVLKCNEKLMTRALENLFDNACRYTKSGDYILFSAGDYDEKGEKGIYITLEDSGSGISAEDKGKIFELFYRNDRGRNSRGMGIGLASVQTIVHDHGGSISCGDSESGGASFTVKLPL